jgi:D-glycero-alpha-D-manno-heptose-7-phosphate kinase
MIISKTPFRMSFFGGGTDYPAYYKDYGGAVLSTSIDKYCYLTCRHLPPFFKHKHRLVYSKTENVNDISSIKHPAIRGVFKYLKISKGLEIHHDADLPAKSGLGSSSSFIVGMLNSIGTLYSNTYSKNELALKAIHLEQNVLNESVGSQDQVAAAYGGLNKIVFNTDNSIEVIPVNIKKSTVTNLEERTLFFFTGFTRFASDIAKHQIEITPKKTSELKTMYEMVDEAVSILKNSGNLIKDFGELLNESWMIKKKLTNKITNSHIDDIYKIALNNGAYGGKVLGAGGGGFIVFYAEKKYHENIKNKLKNILHVPVKYTAKGSEIIFNSDYENK